MTKKYLFRVKITSGLCYEVFYVIAKDELKACDLALHSYRKENDCTGEFVESIERIAEQGYYGEPTPLLIQPIKG